MQDVTSEVEDGSPQMDEGQICEAIRLSDVEATLKLQQDLVEALMRSKSDAVSNKYELLRLCGCSAEITQQVFNWNCSHEL